MEVFCCPACSLTDVKVIFVNVQAFCSCNDSLTTSFSVIIKAVVDLNRLACFVIKLDLNKKSIFVHPRSVFNNFCELFTLSMNSAYVKNDIGRGLKIGISNDGCGEQVQEDHSWSKALENLLHQSLVCLLKY